jgi:hypothetical protein
MGLHKINVERGVFIDGTKKEKHGPSGSDFISSLFNHNPEIPKIDLAGIEPKKEEVFSARTFADTGIHPYIVKSLQDQVKAAQNKFFKST